MFVTKSELPEGWGGGEPPRSDRGLRLAPCDGAGPLVCIAAFDIVEAARSGDREVYRRLLEIRGSWADEPGYAVMAEWRIADTVHEAAFVESRRQLFELRGHVLPTFAADWLLRRLDDAGRYLVLGLYGDEEDLRLCRDHLTIRRFAQSHPAAAYAATDVFGMRFYRLRW